MKHSETHLVTDENGIRPGGLPDRCLYCSEKIGAEHRADCVCRTRTVVVRATIEYTVSVPENWTPGDIAFHRNEGSWCATNMLAELDKFDCLCDLARFEYVREATAEDEERADRQG